MEVLALPLYLLGLLAAVAVFRAESHFEQFMDHLDRQEEREAELLRAVRAELEA
jgi:hypothetical protein